VISMYRRKVRQYEPGNSRQVEREQRHLEKSEAMYVVTKKNENARDPQNKLKGERGSERQKKGTVQVLKAI